MSGDERGIDSFWHGPGDAGRYRRADEIVHRAVLVRRDGWDEYRYTWSAGEVAAVAYVLQSFPLLAEIGETSESVVSRWAFDLYGMTGGEEERTAGFPMTRAFFAAIVDRLEMDEPPPLNLS